MWSRDIPLIKQQRSTHPRAPPTLQKLHQALHPITTRRTIRRHPRQKLGNPLLAGKQSLNVSLCHRIPVPYARCSPCATGGFVLGQELEFLGYFCGALGTDLGCCSGGWRREVDCCGGVFGRQRGRRGLFLSCHYEGVMIVVRS